MSDGTKVVLVGTALFGGGVFGAAVCFGMDPARALFLSSAAMMMLVGSIVARVGFDAF